MKPVVWITCGLLFGHSFISFSQEYSYAHYDITDGLAGSVVYSMTQDKDGFLWIGTETGVSRFDGTHFRNYSVSDGLPDMEVLNMFGDSRGRVWMAPFRKSVCYYYRGKIYNQENDSALHSIRLNGFVENFAEDANGNILIQERTGLHLVSADGRTRAYGSIEGQPIRNCSAICKSRTGCFLVQEGRKIYTLTDSVFTPYSGIPLLDANPVFVALSAAGFVCRSGVHRSAIRCFLTGREASFPFEQKNFQHLSYTVADDSLFYFNEFSGTTEYNIFTGETRKFLPGKQVNRTFRDGMGNTWFATSGQGIFRLNSDEFKTIRMRLPGMAQSDVYAIRRIGDELLAGDDDNYIFRFSLPDMAPIGRFSATKNAKNRIIGVGRIPGEGFYIASDHGIDKFTADYHWRTNLIIPVKSVLEKNSTQLLLGTTWGAGLFDLSRFRMVDTFWHERSTAIYYLRDTIYVGTLNGLYAIAPDRSVIFLGKLFSFFQKRISAMAESPDGTLWVASYDQGVAGYRNGRIVATLTRESGLSSNICRTMLVQNNLLWIGTDKGLNRVNLGSPGYPVTQYSSNDGLGSNIINSIYADGPLIYVGTPAGLSYFNQTRVDASESCSLYLLSISNGGRDRIDDSTRLVIPYSDKHLHLEFVGISYRSVGGISYRYRLLGLDTAWQETRETFLDYPTLPSGGYALEMQAVNKFGVRSRLLTLRFLVNAPFWETRWFEALVLLAGGALVWVLVSRRIRAIRRQQKEKEELLKERAEMENKALQSQMNPHFIFNCLNSIQQFVFDQDMLSTNEYITGFARLIRATLYNSSQSFISVEQEVEYLTTYLSLEKMRFKEKMNYQIDVDPAIDRNNTFLPPMLIQPYVENAVRHGLRHRADKGGLIRIRMQQQGKGLLVIVEDNGIGRRKAMEYQTGEHIEYQSKGMSLTADRMRIIGDMHGDRIRVDVEDRVTDQGQPEGTRVVISLPDFDW